MNSSVTALSTCNGYSMLFHGAEPNTGCHYLFYTLSSFWSLSLALCSDLDNLTCIKMPCITNCLSLSPFHAPETEKRTHKMEPSLTAIFWYLYLKNYKKCQLFAIRLFFYIFCFIFVFGCLILNYGFHQVVNK